MRRIIREASEVDLRLAFRGLHSRSAKKPAQDANTEFRCNLCGCANRVPPARIGREVPSCRRCGSTVRFRAIGRLVTLELLGEDAVLADLGRRQRPLRGLGLSDSATYAVPLTRAFDYENTYFHMAPRLAQPFSVPLVAFAP